MGAPLPTPSPPGGSVQRRSGGLRPTAASAERSELTRLRVSAWRSLEIKGKCFPRFFAPSHGNKQEGNPETMKTVVAIAGAVFVLFTAGDMSKAASFDCTKAATKPEKLICSDPILSTIDEQIDELYRQVQAGASDKEGLRKEQQNWIKTQRDSCRDASCMVKACQKRAAALENTIHQRMQEALKEAELHFTFRGNPINPLALQQLSPWISDSLPGAVAVDIAGTAADTNQYSAEVEKSEKGLITVKKSDKKTGEESSFTYKYLGRLANGKGAHIVETWDWGGGSGVFTHLLLLNFRLDSEYTGTGAPRERLVLTRVGEIHLGDRFDGLVTIKPDQIVIGESNVIGEGSIKKSPRVIPIR